MRADWDARSRTNAFYYIASWRKDWDRDAFFASGEEDYRRLVEPRLAELGVTLMGTTVLELGCGVGRMTRAFATRSGRVVAADISPEMLQQARALVKEPNIEWVLADGQGLAAVVDQSVDVAFSYLVLQHLPTVADVLAHVTAMMRVLKPDGVFLFQFNSSDAPTMNWRGRAAWRTLDRLHRAGAGGLARSLARVAGLDPQMIGSTWNGAIVAPRLVLERIWQAGGAVAGVRGWNSPVTWCYGVRCSPRRAGAHE